MIASSYTGIALALLAATSYNVGLIQEKRALGRMPALDLRRVPRVIASLLADPAWLAGFALMLLGLACQIVVLTFEPVSVVQPVLASGVTLVLVLSRLMLRERLRPAETSESANRQAKARHGAENPEVSPDTARSALPRHARRYASTARRPP